MNPLGINLWNWTAALDDTCIPLLQTVQEMGFTAVELPMTQPTVSESFARAVRESTLAVTLCGAMIQGRDLSSFDAAVRVSTQQYLAQCIRTAGMLGAQVFAGPLYTGGGKCHLLSQSDAAMEWSFAVTGLRELAKLAQQEGVQLAIEPLHRYRTSVVNTAQQALQMVRDIDSTAVGVHFDTFHANIEEADVLVALESVLQAHKLFHFHACANNRGAPGMGHLPWHEIFALLHQYGYKGHLTMETFAAGSLDGSWLPMAKNQDTLARVGLAYLQKHAALGGL